MIIKWSTPKYAFKSLVAFIYNFLKGKPILVTPEVEEWRNAICRICKHHKQLQCEVCTCYVSMKTPLWHERCPLNPPKWK